MTLKLLKYAEVAKLVDAHASGACAERLGGSSPLFGTRKTKLFKINAHVAKLVDAQS